MFMRKRSQRYVLLHSVRDGKGRVRHLRLGQFDNATSLGECLQDSQWLNWKDWFSRQYPEVQVNWCRLRAQAERMFAEAGGWSLLKVAPKSGVSQRVARLRSLIRSLVRGLACETDPQVLQELHDQLVPLKIRLNQIGIQSEAKSVCDQAQAKQARLPASSRRKVYAEGDPEAADYLKHLDDLACSFEKRGLLEECARVLAERVRCCPSPQGRARYGGVLQRLGRIREAIEQYEFIPSKDAVRHYNLASASYREGRIGEALDHLSRGLIRDREVANCLTRRRNPLSAQSKHPYWQIFGNLWCESARVFFLHVYSQLSVRWRLRTCAERGVQPRQLLAPLARAKILYQLAA